VFSQQIKNYFGIESDELIEKLHKKFDLDMDGKISQKDWMICFEDHTQKKEFNEIVSNKLFKSEADESDKFSSTSPIASNQAPLGGGGGGDSHNFSEA
jgi:hypothetical protein